MIIKATGRGKFPTDMLRYALAWPATTADAEEAFNGDPRQRRTVTLNSVAGPILAEMSIRRFDSFGWKAEIEL